ncbi:MAG: cytochrome b [Hyphomicrobiaceae bacterium]
MTDQRDRLSIQTVGLHWVLAVAMIGMLVFGLILEDMPRGDAKSALMWWHKGLGVAVLAFALWRLGWRLSQGFPKALSHAPAWQERMASFTHWFLLLGTLFMPASGIMMSLGSGRSIDVLGLFVIPAIGKVEWMDQAGHVVHGVGSKLLIAAIVLHVVGALKHHLIDKDGTLARIAGRSVAGRANA